MGIGIKEKNAVLDSDIVVVLLPAGKGSYNELGMAIGNMSFSKAVFA